jgi:hypothetical protein
MNIFYNITLKKRAIIVDNLDINIKIKMCLKITRQYGRSDKSTKEKTGSLK